MLLIIDNYDSFTYNLAQYFQMLGQTVQVFRNDAMTLEQITELKPSHIVLSPGPGRPEQAGITLEVIDQFAGQYPILGVCLGHQAIAQYYGGKVVQAQQIMHGKTSEVQHNEQGLFKTLPNPLTVTRYHSLLVEPDSMPEVLQITASTKDKEIMGLAHKTRPVMGVQFHPESILTEQGLKLCENFVSIS